MYVNLVYFQIPKKIPLMKNAVVFILFFLGINAFVKCSEAKDASKVGEQNTSHKDVNKGISTIDSNKIRTQPSPDLISFTYRMNKWTDEELKEQKHTRSAPFIVTKEVMSDSTIDIRVEGVADGGVYSGNVDLNGNKIRLYYWMNNGVAAYCKVELNYSVRISGRRDFQFEVIHLWNH